MRANKDELLRFVFIVFIQGFRTFRLWTLVATIAEGTLAGFFSSLQTSLLFHYWDCGFHARLFARWRLLRWSVRRCILTYDDLGLNLFFSLLLQATHHRILHPTFWGNAIDELTELLVEKRRASDGDKSLDLLADVDLLLQLLGRPTVT